MSDRRSLLSLLKGSSAEQHPHIDNMELSDQDNTFDDYDDDENVEYVEYSDEHEEDLSNYVVVEELDTDEVNSNVQAETDEIASDDVNELYHCSSCNTDFESVEEHIRQYHSGEDVVLDHVKTEAENTLKEPESSSFEMYEVKVKEEASDEWNYEEYTVGEIIDTGDLEEAEVEYIDFKDEEEGGAKVETIFDPNGRLFVRKRVKIDKKEYDFLKQGASSIAASNTVPNNYLDTNYAADMGGYEDEYVCPHCCASFDSKSKLASHIRINHRILSVATVDTKKPRKITNNQQVVCVVCNTTFPSNKSLRLHSRMHGPIKLKPIEEAMAFEMKSTLKSSNPEDMFFCEICNKSYDISFKDVHEKSHRPDSKFNCTICNRKFSNEMNFSMHMKAHQENPKIKAPTKAELAGTTLPYECSYCGRQFARPHEKVKHERIHTGEKPYKCEICGKCFRVGYCLTLHLRTHTTARPYVCPHCNKRFKGYSVYSHHLMTHSDERPYKCPHCPKAFKTSVQLAGHKNSHTKPFSCPECNRPFASLYTVKAHMETHKRQNQNFKHRCPICGAIYVRVFALKDHMKEQHQTTLSYGDEQVEVSATEVPVPFLNENETSAQSILPENCEEITIGEIDHFQTEEVVTDWLK